MATFSDSGKNNFGDTNLPVGSGGLPAASSPVWPFSIVGDYGDTCGTGSSVLITFFLVFDFRGVVHLMV
jgi:hypothetical protein